MQIVTSLSTFLTKFCTIMQMYFLYNFIINLLMDHVLRCKRTNNDYIKASYYTDYEYITSSLERGLVPLKAFVYLDNKALVQNCFPIFYQKQLIVI